MNLIRSTVIKQNIEVLSNWVDSTPVNEIIDSVTYDLYESNNPFRKNFDEKDINNKGLRVAANTTTAIGAEMFSVFSNPYYVTHKITQVPILYDNVVNAYKHTINSKN